MPDYTVDEDDVNDVSGAMQRCLAAARCVKEVSELGQCSEPSYQKNCAHCDRLS